MRFVPIERVEHGMMLAKSIYDYETEPYCGKESC